MVPYGMCHLRVYSERAKRCTVLCTYGCMVRCAPRGVRLLSTYGCTVIASFADKGLTR